jgi:ribonuclease HII
MRKMDPWAYEKEAWAEGFEGVVGVDEAGLGPLAGPVVAAAVMLPRDFDAEGVRDSKMLTAKARDRMFERITSEAICFGIGISEREIIDEINVLRAAQAAMRAALKELGVAFDFILVDGRPVPDLCAKSRAIVKGDALSVSIGAASILAKVTRDRIMLDLDKRYPQYGFAAHKGYCTAEHLSALNEHGPCPCHRRSFAPVSERLLQCRLPGLE